MVGRAIAGAYRLTTICGSNPRRSEHFIFSTTRSSGFLCKCRKCECPNEVLSSERITCVECDAGLHDGYRGKEDREAHKILYGDGPHEQPDGVTGLLDELPD